MRIVLRAAVAIAVGSSILVGAAPAAATASRADPPPPVAYAPPVDAPVSDPFRPPSTPYGPGNRGIEFATSPGTEVLAAADGDVVFAGVVAGRRWVTIRHADGVRTTYGPLLDIDVSIGEHVTGGASIGSAAGALMFTARVGDAYVDPASLFDGGPPRVRLIPEPLDVRRFRFSGGGLSIPVADAVLSALEWEWRHVEVMPKLALAKTASDLVVNGAGALQTWNDERSRCTPAVWTPPRPTERRFALLVGGLGSSTNSAAIADVDADALGYRAGDVVRFSYAGGRVPSAGDVSDELARLPVSEYGPRDTTGDLRAAGHRLAELVVDMAAAVPPGAPIDLLAHSQGGLVARAALREIASAHPEVLDHVRLVVTLATPHNGADLAALVRAADANPIDPGVFDLVRGAIDLPIDPDDPVVAQLAPGSAFLRELADAPVPDGVQFVSVAARGDPVVPSTRAHFDAATANVVVGLDGAAAHDQLPGTGAANREIALAIAGLGPTCESPVDAVVDSTEGTLIENAEGFVAAELGP